MMRVRIHLTIMLGSFASLSALPATAHPARSQPILIQNSTSSPLHFGQVELNRIRQKITAPDQVPPESKLEAHLPIPDKYGPFIYVIPLISEDDYTNCTFTLNGYFFNGHYKYSLSSMSNGTNISCQIHSQSKNASGPLSRIEIVMANNSGTGNSAED